MLEGNDFFIFLKKISLRPEFWIILFLILFFELPHGVLASQQLESKEPIFRESPIELPPLVEYPDFSGQIPAPILTASAVIVMDLDSRTILFERDAKEKLQPASVLKLATALVTLDNCRLDKIIKMPNIIISGSKMGFSEGEEFSVEDLLYGLLLPSGNDVAEVLARNCAKSREDFISAMNQKIKEFGMQDTNFVDPSGLSSENQSTAFDLSVLAQKAIENPQIAKIVATEKITIFDKTKKKPHKLVNLNRLLKELPEVLGVKTGRSHDGENLALLMQKNGKKILTVILGSKERFPESKELILWAFSSHKWVSVNP